MSSHLSRFITRCSQAPEAQAYEVFRNLAFALIFGWIILRVTELVSAIFLVFFLGVLVYNKATGRKAAPTGFESPASIVITGASSGIGEALAKHYAKAAVKDQKNVLLAITGTKKDKLQKVADELRALGSLITVVDRIVDVCDAKEMEKFLNDVDTQKNIDLVIANAGISGSVLDENMPHAVKTRRIFEVNVTGVFNTVLPLVDRFKERKHGQIAVVSSIAGVYNIPGKMAYSASKAALNRYFSFLRPMLAPFNVGVSTIMPGFVRSGMTDGTREKGDSMPFFWETDRAVEVITRGLRNNSGTIAFPFPVYLTSWIMHSLPPWTHEFIFTVLGPFVGTNREQRKWG